MEAGPLVGLLQVDHGRPAVAGIAVHMLEQVQRRAPAAVEAVDVFGLHVESVARQQVVDETPQCVARGARKRQLENAGVLQPGQQFAHLVVGIAQQQGQRAAGVAVNEA